MTKPNISDNTGEGIDLMINDGLRWHWMWLMQRELSQADPDDRRRLPCQICFAQTRTDLGHWRFEAIDWHSGYEARVELDLRHLTSRRNIPSRAKAQELAEVLATDFARQILQELK